LEKHKKSDGDKMDKLMITAAINGAATVPSLTPYLPLTPQDIAASAIEAAEAGAAIVHIHARRPEDGYPSSDPEHFREILTQIKEKSNVIICITTGGSVLIGKRKQANKEILHGFTLEEKVLLKRLLRDLKG